MPFDVSYLGVSIINNEDAYFLCKQDGNKYSRFCYTCGIPICDECDCNRKGHIIKDLKDYCPCNIIDEDLKRIQEHIDSVSDEIYEELLELGQASPRILSELPYLKEKLDSRWVAMHEDVAVAEEAQATVIRYIKEEADKEKLVELVGEFLRSLSSKLKTDKVKGAFIDALEQIEQLNVNMDGSEIDKLKNIVQTKLGEVVDSYGTVFTEFNNCHRKQVIAEACMKWSPVQLKRLKIQKQMAKHIKNSVEISESVKFAMKYIYCYIARFDPEWAELVVDVRRENRNIKGSHFNSEVLKDTKTYSAFPGARFLISVQQALHAPLKYNSVGVQFSEPFSAFIFPDGMNVYHSELSVDGPTAWLGTVSYTSVYRLTNLITGKNISFKTDSAQMLHIRNGNIGYYKGIGRTAKLSKIIEKPSFNEINNKVFLAEDEEDSEEDNNNVIYVSEKLNKFDIKNSKLTSTGFKYHSYGTIPVAGPNIICPIDDKPFRCIYVGRGVEKTGSSIYGLSSGGKSVLLGQSKHVASVIIPSSSNPQDISKAAFLCSSTGGTGNIAHGDEEGILSEPIVYGGSDTIIRIYDEVFFMFNMKESLWTCVKIHVP